MNDKQRVLLEEILDGYEEKYRTIFTELAETAIALGYKPVRNKTQDITVDFRNSKLKKTIMKMERYEQKHDEFGFGERKIPGLRLKYFATKEYSPIFQNAVKRVIEGFGGKYTGCYGCGRCGGKPQGYLYTYPDGKKVFRCGGELLSVFDFDESYLPEMKAMLQRQADFFQPE